SNRLTLQDLLSGNINPLDLFDAKLKLETHVPLHLHVSFAGSKAIPSIDTDFHLDWKFLNADTKSSTLDFGGVPDIGFDNVTLDLGTFANNSIQPIMDTVNPILDPIRPIIDVLNPRLPGFSDLPSAVISALDLDAYDHNGEVSFLDLAQKYLDG